MTCKMFLKIPILVLQAEPQVVDALELETAIVHLFTHLLSSCNLVPEAAALALIRDIREARVLPLL